MCRHYRDADEIIEYVQQLMPYVRIPDLRPQFTGEMFPKYPGLVIMQAGGAASLSEMRWGVWPHYQPKMGELLVNARADGLLTKSVWKRSAQSRRCLVPMTGFYEPGPGPTGARGEVLFTVKDRPCFFIAGLWDTDPDGSGRRGFTLVTTEPNERVAPFKERMLVILPEEAAPEWLGVAPLPDPKLLALCRPFPAEAMAHEILPARPREKLTIQRPSKKPAPDDNQPTLF